MLAQNCSKSANTALPFSHDVKYNYGTPHLFQDHLVGMLTDAKQMQTFRFERAKAALDRSIASIAINFQFVSNLPFVNAPRH